MGSAGRGTMVEELHAFKVAGSGDFGHFAACAAFRAGGHTGAPSLEKISRGFRPYAVRE